MSSKIVWTPEMSQALRDLRAKGTAIYWCAVEIGVSYSVAVVECRRLGIADRRNQGRRAGAAEIERQQTARTAP